MKSRILRRKDFFVFVKKSKISQTKATIGSVFSVLAIVIKYRLPGTEAIDSVTEYPFFKSGYCVGEYVAKSAQTLRNLVSGTHSQTTYSYHINSIHIPL